MVSNGSDSFETMKNGEPVVEHPEVGEVVWRDDAGVTCRRWNWRQCTRTQITEQTKNALFILERLEPYPLASLEAAGVSLAELLGQISPGVHIRTRLIAP
jgi:DNA/RNA-binding domain of Phe-tRNA-synthetase-like protein